MSPSVLTVWFRGLLSIALVVGGVLLVREWFDDLPRRELVAVAPTSSTPSTTSSNEANTRPLVSLPDRIDAWRRDPNRSTAPLVWGGLMLLLALGGRAVSPRLWKRSSPTPNVHPERTESLATRSGHRLHVEIFGPEGAAPLVLVHGLGSDHTQWLEVIESLSRSYRVIAYDLLGHGESERRGRADHSMEAMAQDLDDVMRLAADRKVVVVGHSMGGMIALTWWRLHAAAARERVAGIVLVHTTPRNPFETMAPVGLHRALQKPIHEPLLHLTRVLAPVVRLMSWLSLWNGSIHWSNELQFFAGHERREQLDRTARLAARMDPATQARFALAMTRYDARATLRSIDAFTLVVGADKDGITVPLASEALAKGIRRAELYVLTPARHMGFMEWHEDFSAAVADLARDATKDAAPARAVEVAPSKKSPSGPGEAPRKPRARRSRSGRKRVPPPPSPARP